MNSVSLRVFSYLPNPRLFKSTIAGRICGVDLEIRGAKSGELSDWLWDFDARPLNFDEKENRKSKVQATKGFENELFKTTEFLIAHPYGSVPAGFSPDGKIGIFESNSIMRNVARIGNNKNDIYGSDPYSTSRIDSFLDSSLIFARDSQIYLLSLMKNNSSREIYSSTESALVEWLNGIERSLSNGEFISSNRLSLADICFVCEIALLYNEMLYEKVLEKHDLPLILNEELWTRFSRSWGHFKALCQHPDFESDLEPYLHKLKSKKN